MQREKLVNFLLAFLYIVVQLLVQLCPLARHFLLGFPVFLVASPESALAIGPSVLILFGRPTLGLLGRSPSKEGWLDVHGFRVDVAPSLIDQVASLVSY